MRKAKKIIIAPDSFKGTMSSIEVCDVIGSAIKKYMPNTEVIKLPIADGGEGTVDAYLQSVGGTRKSVGVSGPLGQKVMAEYGILKDNETAVVEMAAASGLPLVEGEKKPLLATTYGTGELISHAVKEGCRRIILGIGGSATTDGGIGALSALGVRFLDAKGNEVTLNGAGLPKIAKVSDVGLNKELRNVEIVVACDVLNPLAGKNGAAHVFSAQKGANEQEVEFLDDGLLHLNKILSAHTGVDLKDEPGMGAAGGICLSLKSFLNVELKIGIDLILKTADFDSKLKGADLVVTGEGKLDGQSINGKVPVGVSLRAKEKSVPVLAIVGLATNEKEELEALYEAGITAIFQTSRPEVPFEVVKETCKSDLAFLAESIFKLYALLNYDVDKG